jgi:hypothetical protein
MFLYIALLLNKYENAASAKVISNNDHKKRKRAVVYMISLGNKYTLIKKKHCASVYFHIYFLLLHRSYANKASIFLHAFIFFSFPFTFFMVE